LRQIGVGSASSFEFRFQELVSRLLADTVAQAQRRPLHRTARISTVIILSWQGRPALVFLRQNKGRAGFTLGVKRVECLFQARMSASGHTSATCDDGIAMSACWFKPHVVRCPSRTITCHFANPASALRRIVEAHPISMARSRRTKLPPRSRRVTINETQSITQFEILVGRPGPSRRLGAVPSCLQRRDWLAEEAVPIEPVSSSKFLATGN
jgi:hypothetical protein